DNRMREGFVTMERNQQGYATAHALLSLIAAMEALPGRKAVLLFSAGLAVPADVEASFESVVAAATRAGVAVYAADVGGLRATSSADDTRRALASLRTRLDLQEGVAASGARASATDFSASGLGL